MSVYDTLRATFRGDAPTYSYSCVSCGTQFAVEHYTCPECGGFSVEAHTYPVAHEENTDGDV